MIILRCVIFKELVPLITHVCLYHLTAMVSLIILDLLSELHIVGTLYVWAELNGAVCVHN